MFTKKILCALVFIYLGVFLFAACQKKCCQPGQSPDKDNCIKCGPGPTTVASAPTPAGTTSATQSSGDAQTWKTMLEAGNYDAVIAETNQIIDTGKGTPGYNQAWLYRGVAKFRLGTELNAARDDLARAQELLSDLNIEEQILLYRSQMVVLAKLGNTTDAEQAYQQALKIAPADQIDAIKQEYKNAIQP